MTSMCCEARLDYDISCTVDESSLRGQYFHDLTDEIDSEDEIDVIVVDDDVSSVGSA